jgi:hypothetical protein
MSTSPRDVNARIIEEFRANQVRLAAHSKGPPQPQGQPDVTIVLTPTAWLG